MTDVSLIEKFLSGDVEAFNMLVWRWEKPMFNYVMRNIGDSDTAKDICQMTFIKTYKQLRRLKDPDKFSPWIYRIATNLCHDEYKKRKRRSSISLNDAGSTLKSISSHSAIENPQSESPEDLCHRKQIGEILKEVLMELPEEQRIVIVMKQYQGLKFTEIAEILKEPVNTVKSRLYYGLRALRKILQNSSLEKEALLHEM